MTPSWRLILTFIQQQRRLAAGLIVALLLSNILNVLLPLSVGLFYETAWQTNSVKGAMLQHWFSFIDSAAYFFVFFGVLIVLKVLFHFLEKYGAGILGERFSLYVREKVFSVQLYAPLPVFDQKPVGNYLLRYSGDLNAIRDLLNRGLLQLAGDLFFLLAALAALFLLDAELALWVTGCWLLLAVVALLISFQLQRATLSRRGQRAKGLAFVAERLYAMYTIKSFNRERPEIERYSKESKRLYRFGVSFYRIQAILQALFPAFFYLVLGLVLWLAWQRQLAGNTVTGDLFAFILLLLHLHSVLQRVLEVNLVWQSGLASLGKLTKLLDWPQEPRRTGHLPAVISGNIRLENISFDWPDGAKVIEDLTLAFPANSITWLQGSSTAGKSTLFKLIQKISIPRSGKLWIDETDMAGITPFEVRKHVTIVSDQAPLIGKTVFQAISYNENPDRRAEAIALMEKLRFALAETPDATLDFRLKEFARNLSASQIAMLQIIRALLSDKKIILLDNPFASLDSRQSARVVRLLNKYKKQHTIIITSRRVPTRLEVDHQTSLDPAYDSEDIAPDAAD